SLSSGVMFNFLARFVAFLLTEVWSRIIRFAISVTFGFDVLVAANLAVSMSTLSAVTATIAICVSVGAAAGLVCAWRAPAAINVTAVRTNSCFIEISCDWVANN